MGKQRVALIIFVSGTVILFMMGCGLYSLIAPTPTPLQSPTPTLGTVVTMVSEKDSMVLVYVPEGEFLMGAAESDAGVSSERPQHTVWLDAFWIDKTEVTNALYQKCVKAGACTAPKYSTSKTRTNYYGSSDYDSYPVIMVNWNQAIAYCGWAGRRLPSEAEWEKAARGTDGRIYPWGNEGVAGDLLNFADKNSDFNKRDKNIDDGYADTAPVGNYPRGASPYGVLDMAGNVWEWVNDWYQEDYYQNSPDKNPTGPSSGDKRVLRGGSWSNDFMNVRTSNRNWSPPDGLYYYIGFRCTASP